MIELLNKYNLKATFNLNSERLNQNNILTIDNQKVSHYKLHKSDVKFIYEGHEVAAHTLTHPNLTQIMDDNEVIRQVEQDRLNLSELVGYDVCGMAYPCGGVNNDERVAQIIKNNTGIKYARTITSTHNLDLQENLYRFNPTIYHLHFDKLMELAKKLINSNPKTPQILYV